MLRPLVLVVLLALAAQGKKHHKPATEADEATEPVGFWNAGDMIAYTQHILARLRDQLINNPPGLAEPQLNPYYNIQHNLKEGTLEGLENFTLVGLTTANSSKTFLLWRTLESPGLEATFGNVSVTMGNVVLDVKFRFNASSVLVDDVTAGPLKVLVVRNGSHLEPALTEFFKDSFPRRLARYVRNRVQEDIQYFWKTLDLAAVGAE